MKHKFNAGEILKVLPSKYYVINLDSKEIIQSNDPGIEATKSKCYQYLYSDNPPCDITDGKCICQRALEKEQTGLVIKKEEGTKSEFFDVKFSKLDDSHIVVSLENVTREYQIKKELKINSKRLQRAENLAGFGYWEFSLDDKLMIASQGAKKIYGASFNVLTLEEAQSYPLKKFRKRLNKSLADLIALGKPYNVKFQIKRPVDGEIRRIHSIAEYRSDKKMVFGVIHDMTETEETQEALFESENSMRHLFKNMNSAFTFHEIITDKNGNPVDYIFLDVNEKFEEITGLKRDDILNKRVSEVIPGIEKFRIERYGKVALTGKPISFSSYSKLLDKHFEIAAYSPKKNYFATTFTDITARVKSATALKESLDDLKMAQQFAKIGNWKYYPANHEFYWSEQVFDILGRDPSLGVIDVSEYKNYFPKQDYKRVIKAIKNTLENNVSSELQIRVIVPDNRLKWVEIICQPPKIVNQNRGEIILHGTVQDITISKRAEEELSNTNKLLRTVIDNIPDAIYMKDTQYRKLIANKGDAINSGVKNIAEIIGKTDYDIYPKEVADIYTEDDKRVIEKGETIINREELLPSGDKNRIILTSKFPLKNNENKIVGLVGIGRDITEIKENESRLNLLQQTVYQTPLPIVITDVKGNIEYVNPGFTKATKYGFDEVIGKNPRILQSGKGEKSYYKNLWETISSGQNWHGEFYNKKKDGSYYWENAVIAPILDDSGEIKHYVAIKEDITEKKQIIEDLKIAKEKAEESNRLKSIFLTNLSHEIRTPLNGILGFTDIICSGITDKKKLEYYGGIIESSGKRLIRVIDDIMYMSMLQSNQVQINCSEFNVNEVLEELFDLYKDLHKNRLSEIGFNLKLVKNGKDFWVKSDKTKMRQVLRYCLDNSFKFTNNGFIRFGYFDSDDKQITLFVEDTGIGIDKDKSEIIFEPFRQGEEGDSRKYEGSGLGLSISTAIMDKIGGSIDLESEKGKGSVFYLKFRK
jgi:PAS domain S-box-containing protein